MSRGLFLRLGGALACATLLLPPAMARAAVADPFAGAAVSDAELAQRRGGLRWKGLRIDFRVSVRDRLNGREVLRSDFELARGRGGRFEFQRLLGAASKLDTPSETSEADVPAAAAAAEPAQYDPGAAHQVTIAPPQNTGAPASGTGETSFSHEIDSGRLLLSVINTANGQNIQRDAEIEITLHNARQIFSLTPAGAAMTIGSETIHDAQVDAGSF